MSVASVRRLGAWLVHGLANGTGAADLAPLITLCHYTSPYEPASPCAPEPFEASLVGRGLLQLTVPGLTEKAKYMVSAPCRPETFSGSLVVILNYFLLSAVQ